MAGTDFEINATSRQRFFIKSLLHMMQQEGNKRELVIKYKWNNTGYYATVGGPLPQMQILQSDIRKVLIIFVNHPFVGITKKERKRLSYRFYASYTDNLRELEHFICEVSSFF